MGAEGKRYAILLDGGFVRERVKQSKGHVSAKGIRGIAAKIQAHPELAGGHLIRVYYYDAPPCQLRTTSPFGTELELAQQPAYASNWQILTELENARDFAVRLGEAKLKGWRVTRRPRGHLFQIAAEKRPLKPEDVEPYIEQKGVDLRIGLDIARLSLCHLADILVVVTGDGDMLPAFKFARREGLRVYLGFIGGNVSKHLRIHSDVVLRLDKDIRPKVGAPPAATAETTPAAPLPAQV